ncbi:hypothetical protein BO78DRAFT_193991 [Aspergillus sclerotiicarbonarius CBS 121057]|uniref:Secreted protein n=1 Tax=Aspergillus sclerotiicarbonarius (strain CBS 121057 / IBT 28362) TaxID=1448318 RepID=A0A319E0J2_ASPSB|nr:hypothetical protein BO78DRAFT_193991 [Aspergillus sclerotiicarbonarius CBS 121057]
MCARGLAGGHRSVGLLVLALHLISHGSYYIPPSTILPNTFVVCTRDVLSYVPPRDTRRVHGSKKGTSHRLGPPCSLFSRTTRSVSSLLPCRSGIISLPSQSCPNRTRTLLAQSCKTKPTAQPRRMIVISSRFSPAGRSDAGGKEKRREAGHENEQVSPRLQMRRYPRFVTAIGRESFAVPFPSFGPSVWPDWG